MRDVVKEREERGQHLGQAGEVFQQQQGEAARQVHGGGNQEDERNQNN